MTSHTNVRIAVLGTGSAGNATVITDGATTVLVDCGLSARETARRLGLVGMSAAQIDAVLVTHEHTDHVRGIDVLCRRHSPACAVYATAGTASAESLELVRERVSVVRAGSVIAIGTLSVVAFSTSHDAADPVGYRIEASGHVVGVATDTGRLDEAALEALRGCDALAIECNHDPEMLDRGPYPPFLKRRIRSAMGHLCNEDAAAAVERLACGRLSSVIAMHRSETNNTERLAGAGVRAALRRIDHGAEVIVASQCSPVQVQL